MGNIRMKVILQVVFFIFFVALTRPSRASEALVMVGGDYLPGFLDNEVEVWSPSNTCDLEVLPTPDYFNGVPGAALLGDQIFVCGGSYIHGQPRDLCDIYDIPEARWREGPALASKLSGIKMATVGETLVAVAGTQNHIAIEMLKPGTNSWTESFPIPDMQWFMWLEDLLVFNDNEVGIPVVQTTMTRHFYILNVNTGDVREVDNLPDCEHSFIYQHLISCVQEKEGEQIILSAVDMEEDFTGMVWEEVETIPDNVWYPMDYHERIIRVVDSKLTIVHPLQGDVFYKEDEDWVNGGTLKVLRERPTSVIVPC